MNLCSSCKRQILWAKTKNGKSIPLDPKPTEEGNVVLHEDGTAEVVKPTEFGTLYVSHFSTCPNATKHRKPKEKKS